MYRVKGKLAVKLGRIACEGCLSFECEWRRSRQTDSLGLGSSFKLEKPMRIHLFVAYFLGQATLTAAACEFRLIKVKLMRLRLLICV